MTVQRFAIALIVNNLVLLGLIVVGAYFFVPLMGQRNSLYPFYLQDIAVSASTLQSNVAGQEFAIVGASDVRLVSGADLGLSSANAVNITSSTSSVVFSSGNSSDIVLNAVGASFSHTVLVGDLGVFPHPKHCLGSDTRVTVGPLDHVCGGLCRNRQRAHGLDCDQ